MHMNIKTMKTKQTHGRRIGQIIASHARVDSAEADQVSWALHDAKVASNTI